MKIHPIIKAVITAVFLSGIAIDVSSQSQTDSLDAYIGMALSRNPSVLQKYNEFQASVQKITQAGTLQDPQLSLGIFLSPMEIVNGKQVSDISLMQMFPWFGTLKAAKDEMSQMAKANFEAFSDAKSQVEFDVKQTWYDLIKTRENIRITEENVDILNTIEKLATVSYRSGYQSVPVASQATISVTASDQGGSGAGSSGMQNMGSSQGNNARQEPMQPTSGMQPGMGAGYTGLADLYRIQIEISDLENNVALMKDRQKTITAKFNSLLDRDPSLTVCLPDSMTGEEPDVPLIQAVDSIVNDNPMVVMLQYEEKSVEARKKMVTLMGYPMAGFGLNYSVIGKNEMSSSSMNGKDMIMPMVTVSLPVYRKKYNAMKQETGYLEEAVRQNYQATINSLQTEYYSTSELYKDAMRRIDLYENQSTLARRSFNLMLKSFESGGASLSDLLQVRRQLLDFELKKVEALTDYNSSVARFRRLAGASETM